MASATSVKRIPPLFPLVGRSSGSIGAVPASPRRLVAIAPTPRDVLRPGSDLARLLSGADEVDLLFASDEEPVRSSKPEPPVRTVVRLPGDGWLNGGDVRRDVDLDEDPDDGADAADVAAWGAVQAAMDATVRAHRLGLRLPLPRTAESDLVAAMSELVGFDPEAGVYCLAPAVDTGDAGRMVLERAVQRIVRVYGLPLLRYRGVELSVVNPLGPDGG